MYIRVHEGLGQSAEELRDFEAQKRHFEQARAEHAKRLAPLPLDILPLDVLQRAGLKTTTKVAKSTASLLQSVIERSRVLRPYIIHKLSRISIPKHFILHDFSQDFASWYLKLHHKVIPMWSQEAKDLQYIFGFYHPGTDSIHLRPAANVGHALHEAIHKFSSRGFRAQLGGFLDEGVTHYFTNQVLAEQGLGPSQTYAKELRCAKELVRLCGHERVASAYFQDGQALQTLVGDVGQLLQVNVKQRIDLIRRGALCQKLQGVRRK